MPSHMRTSHAADELAKRRKRRPLRWILAAAIGIIIAVTALIVLFLQRRQPPGEAGAPEEERRIASIAVLPFLNMSADPEQDFLCDGLADDLITALTHIQNLRVPARTSSFAFKGKDTDIREIGASLDVEAVLEGSISRSGDRLRITAQLIDVASGYHILSEQYNRGMADVFEIRDDITGKIVDRLRIGVLADERSAVAKRSTENTEAYTYYLQGRRYFHAQSRSPETWRQAMECFEKAVGADPDYALAYTGLADVYFYGSYYGLGTRQECLRMAKEAAAKALELDDSLAAAHISFAHIALYRDWDWEAARRHFERALEINPGSALAHWWYHDYLWAVGRADDALAEMERAVELDPLAIYLHAMLGWNYGMLGRWEESWERLQRGLGIDPNSWELYYRISYYHEARGEYGKAVEAALKAIELYPGDFDPYTDGDLGRLYALAGEGEKARRILAALEEGDGDAWYDRGRILVALGERDRALGIVEAAVAEWKEKNHNPVEIAQAFIALGDADRAFEWLDRAYEEREGHVGGLTYIKLDPVYGPIRSDPRFAALLKKMGLPVD